MIPLLNGHVENRQHHGKRVPYKSMYAWRHACVIRCKRHSVRWALIFHSSDAAEGSVAPVSFTQTKKSEKGRRLRLQKSRRKWFRAQGPLP